MKRGSILVVVLWALFLLAALAVSLGSYIAGIIETARRIEQRTTGYYCARAGIEAGIAAVRIVASNAWHSRQDLWANEDAFRQVAIADGAFSVYHRVVYPNGATSVVYGLTDESAKINLNRADYRLLKSLFATGGELDEPRAASIAAAVIDWRDPSNDVYSAENGRISGAEDDYYLRLAEPYSCHNGYFDLPEELRLVRGVDEETLAKVRRYLTVQTNAAATVNINTADPMVLSIVARSAPTADIKACDGLVSALVALRNSGMVFTNRAYIALELQPKLTEPQLQAFQQVQATFGVQATHFGGIAVGFTRGSTNEDRVIEFVIDREGRLTYRRED
jgi:type II secretory pathway component PulK